MPGTVVALGERHASVSAIRSGSAAGGLHARDGFTQIPPCGLLDLAGGSAGEGGPTSQKFTEDRAECEHVGTLVDLITVATSLFGGPCTTASP